MNNSDNTRKELLLELNTLKKENAALKAIYEKDNKKHLPIENGHVNSGMKPDTYSDSISGNLTQQDEQQIRYLFENYIKMYASRDDSLTTHFSKNFSGFTGGGDFLVKDTDEWIAITRQDFDQVKDPIRIEIKDLALQSLSSTIVVTTGFFNIHLPIKDNILSQETARLVLIFRKESEDWKISHSSISIPYHLVREGEVYPLKELTERNKLLEKLVNERSGQLSEVNEKLFETKEILAREIADHKHVELELQQSSQKWEAVISTSPDGIGIAKLDGEIKLISEKLVRMHGYLTEQPDEFYGRSIFDFIDPSDHKRLTNNIRKLLAGEGDQNLTEYLGVRKDNSRFNIDVNSTILHDSDGKPESILYVERNITERKLAEKALRESEEKYRLIFEYSPVGLLSFDEKGVIVACNDKIIQIIGSSREVLIGLNMLNLPDKKLVSSIQKALGGSIASYEGVYHSITAEKSSPVRAIFAPMDVEGGRIHGGVGIIEDITERKNAEKVLQESNQKLEAIISASPDGIGMLSLDGKMLFMSDKLLKMYGYTIEEKDELIGRPATDFIDPSDHERLIDNIRKLISGESDYKIREYLAIKKDNGKFYIELNYTVLLDSNNKPASILFVERDSTERKQVELIIQEQNKQLKELNSAKDKFFSIISHDLKSPFQGLLGMAGLMADNTEEFSTAEFVEHSKSLKKVANNLYKLLENLLEWAQIQQGSINFTPKDFDLSEIIAESITSINQSAVKKGIEVENELPEMIRVYADEKMIGTVLRNLLSNAVKFTKTGGKVIVKTGNSENGKIEISVSDNGVGIPEKDVKRLFKIEEKVSTRGTDGEASTGLGLLLCKDFIEIHGGKIWVESKVNVGSSFCFQLPIVNENIEGSENLKKNDKMEKQIDN